MDRHGLHPGTRATIRTIAEDGYHDVIGWIEQVDDDGVLVEARDGRRRLRWADIAKTRVVGIARGRDPLRTSSDELAALAAKAGVRGRRFVIRLSTLLDGRPTEPPDPSGVQVFGEWAVATTADLVPAAWAAARADARSLLVVTEDEPTAARLSELGFAEHS